MYLKSLTLRGFKSFASSTHMQLEPGITAVVGPNGSGKSNVVDALSWVMGEQGAKTLRGGKMEDVIFAGTSERPPLGRAEVVLTIDNSDGALPIEYSEVTISRTMFRSGGSEYAINGNPCRLLDVQELLSDSGIGREMHVIVGQGQLDSVLRATPEERRGFVEEAAGVLKHRKRKEKALRKLTATEGNLTRLGDVLTELRRQLKPLGRQAEVARRAAGIQADVRDARARLLADEIVTARIAIETELADESALRARRSQVEQGLHTARESELQLEESLASDAPDLALAQETWYSLTSLRDRLSGTASLATERIRVADADVQDRVAGRDPDELEADARRAQEQQAILEASIERAATSLADAVSARARAENAYSAEERRIAELLRAAADRREGLARLHGQVNAVKSRAEGADAEIGRLQAAAQAAHDRAHRARAEFTSLESELETLNAGETGLDEALELAERELDQAKAELGHLTNLRIETERKHAGLVSRHEALQLGLARKDGAGALLDQQHEVSGLLGAVASLVSVRPGYEGALAAALGAAADGLAVVDLQSAIAALHELKSGDHGRASILVSAESDQMTDAASCDVNGTFALDLIEAPKQLAAPLRRLLEHVVVVQDLTTAQQLVVANPELVAVTHDGDVVSTTLVEGGSAASASLLEVTAALEEAEAGVVALGKRIEQLQQQAQSAEESKVRAQTAFDVALAQLHDSDASMSAVAEKLGQLGTVSRSAAAENERMQLAIAEATAARERDLAGLAELEERLRLAQEAPDVDPDTSTLEELADVATKSRQAETDARLTLRTAEERARALGAQVKSLLQSAAAEREARRTSQLRREKRQREAEVARSVLEVAEQALGSLHQSTAIAATRRTEVESLRAEREAELKLVRSRVRELTGELDGLTDSVHQDEMARAQMRLKLEALESRALQELGIEVPALLDDYGPDQLIPVTPEPDSQEVAEPYRFVRADQLKRLRGAERSLAMLGKINPLALEEFAALEERHQFLSEQLDDLRKTRTDLLSIVDDVDTKVEQVFAAAWTDVEREFADVFSRLFPGGEGQLILTDPSNMLMTGIDVEARPPGKKVKRLSLLSGGERSLVAVAFLVALFKARPSPFYILDEVEAALDDTNLGRLLELYEELRANSQLIVITHQKRTMEVADALYGVSMRGDGVSAVISQRIREDASA